jgi:hypothetical protein
VKSSDDNLDVIKGGGEMKTIMGQFRLSQQYYAKYGKERYAAPI